MPFIDFDPNNYQEPKPVANGRYDLTIAAVDEKQSKSDKPMFVVRLDIDGHDDAPSVFHYVSIPYPGCENMVGLNFARFMQLAKVNISGGFDTTELAVELVGKRFNAELTQEEYQGNVSNKLVVPRLNVEASSGRASPPKVRKTA